MKDPIDYYLTHKIKPSVTQYSVKLHPVLNGVFVDFAPVLFEPGDHLDIKYSITRQGPVEFSEYMIFLHEAYKSSSLNIENEYGGSWSLMV